MKKICKCIKCPDIGTDYFNKSESYYYDDRYSEYIGIYDLTGKKLLHASLGTFCEYFIDAQEYRNQKLEKLLND